MNFEMAAEMTGGRCATIVTDDDDTVETSTYSTWTWSRGDTHRGKDRRAAAETSIGRADLQFLGQSVNRPTRSMGVALTSCTVPTAGKPNFDLVDEMEMGVGIHGEPGRRRVKLASARAIAEEMLAAILADLGPKRGLWACETRRSRCSCRRACSPSNLTSNAGERAFNLNAFHAGDPTAPALRDYLGNS
jgi:phosphoenolpyruvate---glycerone phosphotransferase subunit DhaK